MVAPRPAQQCKHPRLFRIRSRVAMAGDPAASCLCADLGERLRPCDSRRLALGHAKTPLDRVGARSRRHRLNPAEAEGRWRGERSKSSGLLAVTTHTLRWGKKSSPKCAMVLLE